MVSLPSESIVHPKNEPPYTRLLGIATAICVVGAYFYQFFYVWAYAVDIPYRDEWDALSPNALPSGFSLPWIVGFYNEHRLVTTKLMVTALFYLDGWDLSVHQFLNYLLYGVLLFAFFRTLRDNLGGLESWVLGAFFLFLASPIAHENHNMGYLVEMHFAVLFLWLAGCCLFGPRQDAKTLAAGVLCGMLAMYSMASNVVAVSLLAILFSGFKWLRYRRDRSRRELTQWAACCAVLLGFAGLWFVGYPGGSGPMTMPTSWPFWNYFFNILSSGIGIASLAVWPGIVMLAVVVAPLLAQVKRYGEGDKQWVMLSLTCAVLLSLAVIAAGRVAGFGVDQAKSPRYTELTFLLIPLTVANWATALQAHPKWRGIGLASLWVICFFTFFNTWSDYHIYQDEFFERSAGVECVKNYYAGTGRGACIVLYPGPLASRLDAARKINLSFYRKLQQ